MNAKRNLIMCLFFQNIGKKKGKKQTLQSKSNLRPTGILPKDNGYVRKNVEDIWTQYLQVLHFESQIIDRSLRLRLTRY